MSENEYRVEIDGVIYIADPTRLPSRQMGGEEIDRRYRRGMWIEEDDGKLRPITMLEGTAAMAFRIARYNQFLARRECCGGPVGSGGTCQINGAAQCVRLVLAERELRQYRRDLNRALDGR